MTGSATEIDDGRARPRVHKFGGTSVADAARIRRVAGILKAASDLGHPVIAVSSALGGVTNRTLEAARHAAVGDRTAADAIAGELRDRHRVALRDLCGDCTEPALRDLAERVRGETETLLTEFEELLHGTSLVKDLSPRTSDRLVVTGEKIAVRLLALSLAAAGADAAPLDADTFLEVRGAFQSAEPASYTDCPGIRPTLTPLLDRGVIPVVTGFCGKAPDGATATLGRGGSDLSATLIGAALRAAEVVIWTDVDGVYSADPRIVPAARRIDRLNVREAAEMSYYGAKVLHPRTMIPVSRLGIPVRIKSSFQPELPGTVVENEGAGLDAGVKAVTAVRDQAIIEVQGKGMVGVPGVAGRVFSAIAGAGISVTMISQSSSEASVCFAVSEHHAAASVSVLQRAFAKDIDEGLIEAVQARTGTGLIAVVGLGMAHTPGIAARVFGALAKSDINVLAIAQGSSELNITLSVDSGEVDTAIRAIHGDLVDA